jgi:hypothetical protein
MTSKYYIVYPKGDRSKISVVEIDYHLTYELSDYAVASRNSYFSEREAITNAKNLARDNKLTYIGDDYLD